MTEVKYIIILFYFLKLLCQFLPSPPTKKAVIILIVPVSIKEIGLYSGMYYRKSLSPDWISLAGMDSLERISQEEWP